MGEWSRQIDRLQQLEREKLTVVASLHLDVSMSIIYHIYIEETNPLNFDIRDLLSIHFLFYAYACMSVDDSAKSTGTAAELVRQWLRGEERFHLCQAARAGIGSSSVGDCRELARRVV